MDTLKILLGATIALLLGALAVSYKNNAGSSGDTAGKTELADMKRQLAEIQLEQDRLQTERERRLLEDVTAKVVAAQPAAEVAAADSAEIEAMKAEIALLQEEKDKANRNADTADKEAAFVTGKVTESRDKEARRARVIKDALVMARVREWIQNDELGGFATIDIVMPENVIPDTVLCVRRNTGILGRLKVGEVTMEGGIANPVGSFGDSPPEPGDELIMEPPF
jgi:hypothetical protein